MEMKSNWENMLERYDMVCRKVIKYETGFNHHFDSYYGSEKEKLEKEFEYYKNEEKVVRASLDGYMAAKLDEGEWNRVKTLELLNNIRFPRQTGKYTYFALTCYDNDRDIEDYYYNPHVKLLSQNILVFDSREDLERELAKSDRTVEITYDQAAKIVGDERYLVEGNYVKSDDKNARYLVVDEWKPCIDVRKVGL